MSLATCGIVGRMGWCLIFVAFLHALRLVNILALNQRYEWFMKLISAIGCASRGRAKGEWHNSEHRQMLEMNSDRFSNAISTVQKDFLVALIYETS